ncbi:hypothetical protein ANANG_G00063390 [Anguilla anguilla]|uniref:Uncharacterized protein n=1 Tax=Anguilla anguilla TaxID=7936 RepID=A0A9D3MP74_ANGAN|nr:hypothetical protein ANANG_G00063390 [Anguilla anguilla]
MPCPEQISRAESGGAGCVPLLLQRRAEFKVHAGDPARSPPQRNARLAVWPASRAHYYRTKLHTDDNETFFFFFHFFFQVSLALVRFQDGLVGAADELARGGRARAPV